VALTVQVNVEDYPFDTQTLIIKLGSFLFSTTELQMYEENQGPAVPDAGKTEAESIVSTDRYWLFSDVSVELKNAKERGSPTEYHQYVMQFSATREGTFVVITSVFPLMLLGLVATLAFFLNPGKDTRVRFLSALLTSTMIFIIGVYAQLPQTDSLSRLSGLTVYTLLHLVSVMVVALLLKSAYLSSGGWLFEKSKDLTDEEKRLKLSDEAQDRIKVEGGKLVGQQGMELQTLKDTDKGLINVVKQEEYAVRLEQADKASEINFFWLLFKIFLTRTRLSEVPTHQKKKAFKFVLRLNDAFRALFPLTYFIICMLILFG